jgi:methyltransferase (TIGR00027 family)
MTDASHLAMLARGAVGAARQRALHLLMDGEPKVFVDEWAIKLTGDDPEALRERASTVPFPRSAWVLQSRYTEDLLADALGAGCRQYVILGAGLDSFVQRHADALAGLRVYEVDDPPLQNWKRARLTQLGVFAPPQCVYVPCDFASQSLSEALRQAGFAADQPAFVSWLAVTQYLSQAAITETLAWVRQLGREESVGPDLRSAGGVRGFNDALPMGSGSRDASFRPSVRHILHSRVDGATASRRRLDRR